MPVDPYIAAMLEELAMGDSPRLRDQTPQAARLAFREFTSDPRIAGEPVPVADVRDCTVPGAESSLRARVYRPMGDGPYPTLVFFHGGGFVIGDLETHDRMARRICRGCEAVVVSVDYRLAPEHPFPAAPADAEAAACWIAERLAAFGGARGNLALVGDSAGGNLAAGVAQRLPSMGVPVAGQLLIYPVVDMTSSFPSRREYANGYWLDEATSAWYDRQYVGSWADLRVPRLSPLYGDVHPGVPPALIITAEYDPLRDEGEAYGARLRDAGVSVEVVRVPGMIHGFFDMAGVSPSANAAIHAGCERFRNLLRA